MNNNKLLQLVKIVPTKTIPLNKIVYDKNNPNKMSDVQMQALDDVVVKYGFAVDPWVNKQKDGTYMVIDGEHRVKMLQNKGIKKIQAKIFEVSYADVRILRQVANKLRGEHDGIKDASEIKAIFEDGNLDEFANMLAQPLDEFHKVLEKNFDISFEKAEEEPVPEPPIEPKTKLGDIYKLGKHVIMCGDSSDKKAVDNLLQDNKVNSLQTDPPYGVDYASKNEFLNKMGKGNRNQTPILNDKIDDHRKFFVDFLKLISFAEYNTVYFWLSDLHALDTLLAFDEAGIKFHQNLIWVKNNHVLSRLDHNSKHETCYYGWKGKHKYYGGQKTNIYEIDKPLSSKEHPTMKPVELIAEFVKEGSEKGDNVYDAFLGSGSTLIACEQTGRICYGMELDPRYIDVIIKRWENFTGKKAKLQ